MLSKVKNKLAGSIIFGIAVMSSIPANALVIGIEDNAEAVMNWLNFNGYSASLVDSSVASAFNGLDVFMSVRGNTDANTTRNVTNFVANGGGFVSEYSSIEIIMSMFGGTTLGNNKVGRSTTIDVFEGQHAIVDGVSDFSSTYQTEYNWNTDITNTDLQLLGTMKGQNAVMVGQYNLGHVVGISFDWQDDPWSSRRGSGSADLNRLLLNSLNWASVSAVKIPEPGTLALLALGLAGLGMSRRYR